MLRIIINGAEEFDEKNNEFLTIRDQELQLEHSLVSLSKWESFWKKPFLTKKEKTTEESLDYVRCMTLTQNVDPKVYNLLTTSQIDKISKYIEDPMTATTFSKRDNQLINREIITAEVIYYWMIALSIPFECQKWHLNRLLTLINVCNIKNQPKKNIKTNEILNRNRELNAARRAQLNTTG